MRIYLTIAVLLAVCITIGGEFGEASPSLSSSQQQPTTKNEDDVDIDKDRFGAKSQFDLMYASSQQQQNHQHKPSQNNNNNNIILENNMESTMMAALGINTPTTTTKGTSNNQKGGSDDTGIMSVPSGYFSINSARRRTFHSEAVDCSGLNPCVHGRCVQGSGCICDQEESKGFWSGTTCAECLTGYAGPSCKTECSGGSCNQCNENGVCSEGTTGDGSCTCFGDDTRGHWGGDECKDCADNYFGTKCQKPCPGLVNGNGLVCYGRGTCSSGVLGDGECTCQGGWGSASGCEDCDDSHYSIGCTQTCVGYVVSGSYANKPCSGHGRCSNGTAGDGSCTCNPTYGTQDCSKQCPSGCSGHGDCQDGADRDAKCLCNDNWAIPDCGSCIAAKTGPDCTVDCPRDPTSNLVCSNKGHCMYNETSLVARCECAAGYAGTFCEIQCPGTPPCSSNGVCNAINVTCTCFADSVRGYWTGDVCDTCAATYNNSAKCTVACPVSGGAVCSGHGECREGICFCIRNDPLTAYDYCDTACDMFSIAGSGSSTGQCSKCSCLYCDDPFMFDTTCERTCPGYIPNLGIVCNGHGKCDEGKSNTGLCYCDFGYTGPACELTCLTSNISTDPCSGFVRGVCDYSRDDFGNPIPICTCRAAYAGSTCEIDCPVINGDVCTNHGTCNVNGICECTQGYTGTSCSLSCYCDTDYGDCDHTACKALEGVADGCGICNCNPNFIGLCNECVNGTQGDNCDGLCINGTTNGKVCDCNFQFSYANCSVPCPVGSNGLVCGGNGNCSWGARLESKCSCLPTASPEWFGPTCEVNCIKEYCTAFFGYINPQCNADTGICECQDDQNGRWALGTGKCDECQDGYWGPKCAESCDCNDNGICDQTTGECSCFADTENGFFTGANCLSCATGYIGASCDRQSVRITRQDLNVTGATSDFLSAPYGNLTEPNAKASFYDEEYQELYIGGRPVGVFDVGDALSLRLSTRTQATQVGNRSDLTVFGCATDPGEAAMIWTDKSKTFYLMQPSIACNLPARILQVTRSKGATEFVQRDVTLTLDPDGKLNTSMRIISAYVQRDESYSVKFVPPHIVVFVIAQTYETVLAVQQYPGGFLVRVDMDLIQIQQDSPLAILFYDFSPVNMLIRSVAMNTYVDQATFEVIGVSGSINGLWDVYAFAKNTTGLEAAYDNKYSIKAKAPCWPAQGGTDAECITDDCFCRYCTQAENIHFSGNSIVVTMLMSTGTSLVWLRRIQDAAIGTVLLTNINSLCRSVEVKQGGIIVDPTSSFSRGIVPCDGDRCESVEYFVSISAAGQDETAVPTSMAFDRDASVTFVAISLRTGASQLLKFSLDTSAFGLYGVRDLGFVTDGSGKTKAEVITTMTIGRLTRRMYAGVGGIPRLIPIPILLYEVHSLLPNVGDNRGGTVITVVGNGFLQQSQTNSTVPYNVTCRFGDNEYVPAVLVDYTHLTCIAPTQATDATGSDTSSCDGQPFEVTIYGTKWFTDNQQSILRTQSAALTAVSPDRGPVGSPNVVLITGSHFIQSEFSLCRFNSTNVTSTQTLYSPVTFVNATAVYCTQPKAEEASIDVALVDIALDGQLYSDVTPLEYQIVGIPTSTQTDPPYPEALVLRTTNHTTFSITTHMVDKERHKLETLDTQPRTMYLFVHLDEGPCEDTYTHRIEGDGYPWPPCRNATLNDIGLNPESTNTTTTTAPEDTTTTTMASTTTTTAAGSNSSNITTTTTTTMVASTLAASGGARRHFEAQVNGETWVNSTVMYNGELALKASVPYKTGYVKFDDLFFSTPRKGLVTMRIALEGESWIAEQAIRLIEGDPEALAIKNRIDFGEDGETYNKFYITTDGSLSEKFLSIVVLDILGNIVTSLELGSIYRINASSYSIDDAEGIRYDETSISIAPPTVKKNFEFEFSDIKMRYIHGRAHYLRFQATTLNAAYPNLRPNISPEIRTQGCEKVTWYKVPRTDQCLACPSTGASCNGTEVILVKPGYWRANSTSYIYLCPGGETVCLGSLGAASGSTCEEGYEGPLCSLCQDNYGRSGATNCVLCPPFGESLAAVIGVGLIVFGAVIAWTISTLRKAEVNDVSVIMRTLVNHMQATGELGQFSQEFDPFVKGLFDIQSGASGVSVGGLQSLDCVLKAFKTNYEAIFYAYMSLPGLAVFIGFVVTAVVRILRLKPVITDKLRSEILEDVKILGAHSKMGDLLEKYPIYMVLITTLCVTMFTLYQTLIAQSTKVLKCTEYIIGQTADGAVTKQQYLDLDMSIECDSNGNHQFTTPALMFTIVYGLGIPLMFICGHMFVNSRIAKPELTKLMFMFLTGGYQEKYWYWQAIIMIRKMTLVCIVVFINDNNELQSFCAVWFMSIALILQVWVNPNEKAEHNLVEAMSLTIITITLNLSLLYFWKDLPDIGKTILTTALLVVTLGAICMFAYFLFEPSRAMAMEQLAMVRDMIRDFCSKDQRAIEERKKRRDERKAKRLAKKEEKRVAKRAAEGIEEPPSEEDDIGVEEPTLVASASRPAPTNDTRNNKFRATRRSGGQKTGIHFETVENYDEEDEFSNMSGSYRPPNHQREDSGGNGGSSEGSALALHFDPLGDDLGDADAASMETLSIGGGSSGMSGGNGSPQSEGSAARREAFL